MSDHKKPVANNTENKENEIKGNEKKILFIAFHFILFFFRIICH